MPAGRHLRCIILDIFYDFKEFLQYAILTCTDNHLRNTLLSLTNKNQQLLLSRFFGCKSFLCVMTERNLTKNSVYNAL